MTALFLDNFSSSTATPYLISVTWTDFTRLISTYTYFADSVGAKHHLVGAATPLNGPSVGIYSVNPREVLT